MNLTLDTNAIIDLEENRPSALSLRRLIELHRSGHTCVRVVGISASERQQNAEFAPTFETFQAKIVEVGLGEVEILKPPFWWDLTYWDWSMWDIAKESDLRAIHEVLFPISPFDCVPGLERRWRNEKCDVLGLWSHIYYDGDVFVTRDSRFLSSEKRTALVALGAKQVCSPEEALQIVQATLLA